MYTFFWNYFCFGSNLLTAADISHMYFINAISGAVIVVKSGS